ncbi:MAG TPA: UvrB/UvrC motif-containing protein [Tepidisphaeraceae bacterium]|jgi:hypothetical protein
MSDELSRAEKPEKPEKPEKHEFKSASKDISSVLRGWAYEPGVINVRKIHGVDGLPKIQMRLDLGLLQMEMNGRPDGLRPHGYESLLEYYENQLAEHEKTHEGSASGFHLNPSQCASLREEAVQYYHRYLSLFVLEEFPGVVRDTGRNLRLLEICGKYADDEQDRLVLEQYRPYITMMHARAQASILNAEKKYPEALEKIEDGLAEIKDFFVRFGQEEAYNESSEVRVLKKFARDIRKKIPVSPLTRLQRKLEKAVKDERYEEAARLRDKITELQQQDAAENQAKA